VAPGLEPRDVVEDMDFRPDVADKVERLEPPRPRELAILREEIDPDRVVIAKDA
jgi:hypothetical protein